METKIKIVLVRGGYVRWGDIFNFKEIYDLAAIGFLSKQIRLHAK